MRSKTKKEPERGKQNEGKSRSKVPPSDGKKDTVSENITE